MRQRIKMFVSMSLMAVTLAIGILLTQGFIAVPVASGQIAVQGIVAQNSVLQYQGQLFNPNGGQPLVNQTVSASFRLYGQASGGSPLWFEDKSITTNSDGLFNSLIGSTTALNQGLFDGRDLYLAVAIGGEEGNPRLPIGFVPYAMWASNADMVDGLNSTELMSGASLAYGEIDQNGNKVSGTNNWSSRIVVVDAESVYEVRINGVDYKENDYTTIVTPGCAQPRIVGTGSSEGALLIDMWNDAGSRRTDCKFQFVTFRRP